MDTEKIKSEIITALANVAPDVQVATLDPARSFRDQCEFDSIDFVDLMLKLEARLGIAIPQSDYPKLSSMNGALRYLTSAVASAGEAAPGSDRSS